VLAASSNGHMSGNAGKSPGPFFSSRGLSASKLCASPPTTTPLATVSSCRALQLVCQTVATPVGGAFSDDRPRAALGCGLALCGVSLLLASAATQPWHLFATYGLLAVRPSEEAAQPSCVSYVASLDCAPWPLLWTCPPALQGVSYGATNFNVAVAIINRVVPLGRHGLATGVATAGSPIGQMVLVRGLPVFSTRRFKPAITSSPEKYAHILSFIPLRA